MNSETTNELIEAINKTYLGGYHLLDFNELLKTHSIIDCCSYLFTINDLKKKFVLIVPPVYDGDEIIFAFQSSKTDRISFTINIEMGQRAAPRSLVGYALESLPIQPQSAKGKTLILMDDGITVPHNIIAIAEGHL